ncbi:MAG: hypothetical protein AAGU78_12010, partial [Chloroflexota bacterium]
MQRFVPPVFESDPSADERPETPPLRRPAPGVRWRVAALLAAATLALAFGSYRFTLQLLEAANGAPDFAGARSQLPALAMAVLAGAAAIGLIG